MEDFYWPRSSEQLLCEARAEQGLENLTCPDFIPAWERFKRPKDRFTFKSIEIGKGDHRVYRDPGGHNLNLFGMGLRDLIPMSKSNW